MRIWRTFEADLTIRGTGSISDSLAPWLRETLAIVPPGPAEVERNKLNRYVAWRGKFQVQVPSDRQRPHRMLAWCGCKYSSVAYLRRLGGQTLSTLSQR